MRPLDSRLAAVALLVVAVSASCSTLNGGAESRAREAYQRASGAAAEAEQLRPTRDQQNAYGIRMHQAREALDHGDWEAASHASQLAADKAHAFTTEKLAQRETVTALISGAEVAVDEAQDHPDPRVDLPNFVYYVSNEIHSAQSAFDAMDYDYAEKAALHAHALIDKKAQLFTIPPSDSIAAEPVDLVASAASSGPVVCYWPSRSGNLAACSVVVERTVPSSNAECKQHGFPRALGFGDASDGFRWFDAHCCPRFRAKR
jgi:hypothetical protein